jgi:hypothetical protein
MTCIRKALNSTLGSIPAFSTKVLCGFIHVCPGKFLVSNLNWDTTPHLQIINTALVTSNCNLNTCNFDE